MRHGVCQVTTPCWDVRILLTLRFGIELQWPIIGSFRTQGSQWMDSVWNESSNEADLYRSAY